MVTTQQAGGRWGGAVPADFRPRFLDAYDAEIQAWIAAVADGSFVAPRSATAWDGYVAAAVCEAAEHSLTADGPVRCSCSSAPLTPARILGADPRRGGSAPPPLRSTAFAGGTI